MYIYRYYSGMALKSYYAPALKKSMRRIPRQMFVYRFRVFFSFVCMFCSYFTLFRHNNRRFWWCYKYPLYVLFPVLLHFIKILLQKIKNYVRFGYAQRLPRKCLRFLLGNEKLFKHIEHEKLIPYGWNIIPVQSLYQKKVLRKETRKSINLGLVDSFYSKIDLKRS